MGMGAVPAGKGKRRRTSSDINVTPLVDVMLVLLVIFMITAQASKSAIDIELPQAEGTSSAAADENSEKPLEVTVDASSRINVGGNVLELARIKQDLAPYLKGHEKETLILKADRAIPYESVIKVVAAIRAAGIETVQIAVETDADE